MSTGENSQPIGPAPPPNPAPPPPPPPPPSRLPAPDIAPSSSQISDLTESSRSQAWCPTPADPNPWSGINPGSPTSSPVSNSETLDGFPLRPHMIGKWVWGAQDWFSAIPRLDQSMSLGLSNDGSMYGGGGGQSPTPSSTFSLHALSHGVVDRYDLMAALFSRDLSSEVGLRDTSSFLRPRYVHILRLQRFHPSLELRQRLDL
jgi:hypothetical protein